MDSQPNQVVTTIVDSEGLPSVSGEGIVSSPLPMDICMSPGFNASRVDFSDSAENLSDMLESQKEAWMGGIRDKARKACLHATHRRGTWIKTRAKRLPIESDDDGESPVETPGESSSSADTEARMCSMLARIHAHMVAANHANSEDNDWARPGKIEVFLDRCLASWEAHNLLLEANEKLRKELERSRRSADELKQHAQKLEHQNGLLAWYATHLQGQPGAAVPASFAQSWMATPLPVSPLVASVLQGAHEAALKAAELGLAATARAADK